MAGGAGRGIIWRGRFTGVNRGAGARFQKKCTKVLDMLLIMAYNGGMLE